ncbi:MAG: methyltransferase domain-containing protein [Planctomycetes bacterium]|nr:methyltransferase domain-containing protein [Planctomycetota bacterium]
MTDVTDDANPPDIFHTENDEEYQRLLKEEMDYWNERDETLLSCTPEEAHQRYFNERLTGNPERDWFETIADYGTFKRGCVLGAGAGIIEEHLLEHHPELTLVIYDIAGDALERIRTRLDANFPGRTETRQEDMNFLTLPEEAFDLVLSDSCIHHVLNLEHLAFQANRTLTADGYFFLRDYVGESYFQFSPAKKQLFETFVRATSLEEPTFNWPDRENWIDSPFEAVRSGETLGVFRRYLSEEQVRTSHAFATLLFGARVGRAPGSRALRDRVRRRVRRLFAPLFAPILSWLAGERIARQATAAQELLLLLDGILSDSKDFPGGAFAVYRKRPISAG